MQKLLDYYLNRGFGSMTKNDFEVYIFNHLLHTQLKGESDYAISVFLKIPESKVKRLRYESELKFGELDGQHYSKQFMGLLAKAILRPNHDKQVYFSVENVALRKFISAKLKEGGRFLDSSFNSELVVIHVDDLAYLITQCTEDAEKKDILDQLNLQVSKNKDENNKLFEKEIKEGIVIKIDHLFGANLLSMHSVDLGIPKLVEAIKDKIVGKFSKKK